MEIDHKIVKIYRIIALINFLLLYPAYSRAALLNPEYISSIQQKISACFVYPQEAQTKGWEGMVKVRFTLDQGGRIKEINIAESSGYPLLDAGALLAVKDASPYPLPQGYNKEELEMVVPISYEQDKSLEPSEPQEMPTLQQAYLTQPIRLSETVEEKQTSAEDFKGAAAELDPALYNFVDLAIKNNPPLKVARQEIELAQFKILENQRNLFPTLKISGYKTDGDVYKVDYEEWEPAVEVTQPLFRGGQLVNAVRQAGVDLEITKKNYDRIKFELMQKAETAYYNLAVAKMHLRLKEALLEEAKETLGKIEKLGQADMVIPLEVNSARSWFDQIQFQADNIKQDVLNAELTLKQVLNTKELGNIMPPRLSAPKKTKLELSTCTEMALVNHPEIRLSELLVKFNDYSQKMKRSDVNSFSIDLTSSYGYYKGHYINTPWEDTDNWFAGVKLTKPWGGSTFSTSYNAQKQRARFGEAEPSKYQMVSADFSVLDNLKRVSDKKKSEIDLWRSLSDFNETTKAVTLEVQEAFFNYQKAISQLNTAEMEMKFRRNETDVIKIRSMVGEANLSSAMESLYNLSESQAKYIQALGNYQTSLASLKKATGYSLKI
ncbi:MAG: TonB family protein [Candidatus Omnitrophica bacterium]|nr:TonB family protein [Candidatus Omnitrophota bacterium]MDD5592075.1 TonB family protein [Candidatus Omnitrophota bacterium]